MRINVDLIEERDQDVRRAARKLRRLLDPPTGFGVIDRQPRRVRRRKAARVKV